MKQTIINLQHYINREFDKIPNFEETWGLCCNVLDEDLNFLLLLKSWEHFSGNIVFPVECSSRVYSTKDSRINRHNLDHKYGKLRLDLAKHLLKELLKLENNDEV